jgi:phosphate transport system permease protein
LLAISRASGETAPLLFTAGMSTLFIKNLMQPTASMTVLIYYYALSSVPSWISQAWGAALILILIMLALNLLVRLILGRNLTETRVEI